MDDQYSDTSDTDCNPDLLTEVTLTHLEYPDGSVAMVPKSGSGRMSPIRARTMKEYDQQITDLKKENFSLKLRIYFLQERLEHKFGDGEDVFKTNIELRVECESLKKEMSDKHELLKKASSAMESVTSVHKDEMDKLRKQNENEVIKLSEQFHDEIEAKTQDLYFGEEKIGHTERRIIELETEILAYQMQVQDKAHLQENLNEKDAMISGLNADLDEKSAALEDAMKSHDLMMQTCSDLKQQLRQFEKNLVRKDQDVEDIVDEKTDTVTDLRERMTRITDDLTEKNGLIEGLENLNRVKDTTLKDLESEFEKTENAKLNAINYATFMTTEAKEKDKQLKSLSEQLDHKEAELKRATEQLYKANMDKYEGLGIQDGNIKQEETIQALQGQIKQKDIENERLKHNVNNRDAELSSFKDLVSKAEEGLKDSELAIQDNAHPPAKTREARLPVNQGKRSPIKEQVSEWSRDNAHPPAKTREARLPVNQGKRSPIKEQVSEWSRDNAHPPAKTREARLPVNQGKRSPIKEQVSEWSRDLQEQLQKERERTTDKLEEQANHYQALLDDAQRQLTNKDKILHQLTGSLKDKDKQLQEYLGLINLGPSQSNESLVSQLQGSLKQRDKDLEDAIGEKFETIKEKDDEVRHLKLSIREKEREVDRAKQMLLATEEQLDMLEQESRDKDHVVKQLASSLRTAQKALEELEDSHAQTLEEKDGSIRRLQNALTIKTRALEEAVSQSALGDSSTLQDLQQRLRDKEKIIENMIHDRNKAAEKYDEACRENTRKLQDKDNEIKQFVERHAQEVSDLGREIQKLQTDLNRRDHELQTAESRAAWEDTLQKETTDKMRAVLQEKDRTIEALVESGQEKEKLFRQLQTSQSLDASPNRAKLWELREENARLKNELEKRQDTVDHSHSGSGPAGTYSQKYVDELESEFLRSKQDLRDAQLSAKEAKQQLNDLYHRVAAGGVSADALQCLQREVLQLREQLKTGSGDNVIKSDSKEIQIERIIREAGGSSEGHKVTELSPSHDRQIYISLNQTTSSPPHASDGGSGGSSARSVETELAAVQALRQKLQDDVMQNQRVRSELEQHLANVTSHGAATPSDSTDSAIGLREENDLLKRELVNVNRRNSELAFKHVNADSTTADIDKTTLNAMSPSSLRKALKGIQAKLHESLNLNDRLKEQIAATEPERGAVSYDLLNQQHAETLTELERVKEDNGLLRSKFGISASEDAAVLPDVNELRTLNQKLKSKVRSLDSINNVFKSQIEASLKPGSDSSHINTELLIKMAKKIEKLKEELRKERESLRQLREDRDSLLGGATSVVRSKLSKDCQTDGHSYTGSAPPTIQPSRIPVAHSNSSTMVGRSLSDYDVDKSKQPDVVRNALREARAQIQCLQKKVLATEATCRTLTRKMSYYRRVAEDAGIPMEPARRSQSESCLIDLNGLDSTDDQSDLLVSISDASNLSVALSSIKSKLSSVDKINMETLGRFGESNDIGELKQQVMELRKQIENYHLAICDISLNMSDSRLISSELLKEGDASTQNNMHNETLTEPNGEDVNKQLASQEPNGEDVNKHLASQEVTSTEDPVNESLSDSLKYKHVEIVCLKKQLSDSQNLCTQLQEQLDEVNTFLERALYREQSFHGYRDNDDVTHDGMIQALSVTQEILKDLTCTLEVADPTADGGDELSVTESKQELNRRLQKALKDNDALKSQLAEISFVKNEEKAKLEESRISQEASNLLLHEQLRMRDQDLYSAQHNLDQLTKNLAERNSGINQHSDMISSSHQEQLRRGGSTSAINQHSDMLSRSRQEQLHRGGSTSGSLASDESLDGNKRAELRPSGRTRKYSPSKRAMHVQEQFSDSESDELVTVRKKPSRVSLSKQQQPQQLICESDRPRMSDRQPRESDRPGMSDRQTRESDRPGMSDRQTRESDQPRRNGQQKEDHSLIAHTSQQGDLLLERTRHRTASGQRSNFSNIHLPLHAIDKSEIVFEPSLSSTVSEASEHQRYSLRESKYDDDDDYNVSRKICEQIYERRTGIYGRLNGIETANMTPGSLTETDSVGISGVDSHLLSSGREKSVSPDNDWNVKRKQSSANNSRRTLSPRQQTRSPAGVTSNGRSLHESQHGDNNDQRNASIERGTYGEDKLHTLQNKLQSMEVMNKTLKDELNLYESIHMSVGASRLSLLGLTGADQTSRLSLLGLTGADQTSRLSLLGLTGADQTSRLSLLGLAGADQSRLSLGVNTTSTDHRTSANFRANSRGGDDEASCLNKTRSTATGSASVNISTRRGNAGVQTSLVSSDDQESGILREHLAEIRAMRIRLEESLNHNDLLREQLEKRLREEDDQRGSSTVNIYIHEEGRMLTADEIQQHLFTLREEIHERETVIAEKIVIIQEKEQEILDCKQELAARKDMLSGNGSLMTKNNKKNLEKDELLVEKESRIIDMKSLLKQKEGKLIEKEERYRGLKRDSENMRKQKDRELSDAEHLLKQIDSKLSNAERLLEQKDSELSDAEHLLKQIDSKLSNAERLLEQKDSELSNAERLLEQKDSELSDAERLLEQKDSELSNAERLLKQKDSKLSNAERLLKQKDSELSDAESLHKATSDKLVYAEKLLKSKDDRLLDVEKLLKQRDKTVLDKDTLLREITNKVVERETLLKDKDAKMAEKDKALAEKEALFRRLFHKKEIVEGDLKQAKKDVKRLTHDLHSVQDKAGETEELNKTLKFELSVYEKMDVVKDASINTGDTQTRQQTSSRMNIDITELFLEMKNLRIQLERCIKTNNELRQKLEENLLKDSPVSQPSTTINIKHFSSDESPHDSKDAVDGMPNEAQHQTIQRNTSKDTVTRHVNVVQRNGTNAPVVTSLASSTTSRSSTVTYTGTSHLNGAINEKSGHSVSRPSTALSRNSRYSPVHSAVNLLYGSSVEVSNSGDTPERQLSSGRRDESEVIDPSMRSECETWRHSISPAVDNPTRRLDYFDTRPPDHNSTWPAKSDHPHHHDNSNYPSLSQTFYVAQSLPGILVDNSSPRLQDTTLVSSGRSPPHENGSPRHINDRNLRYYSFSKLPGFVDPANVDINSDIRNLFAIAKIDDYERLQRVNHECCVVLSGIEARIKERLSKFKESSPSQSVEYSVLKELSLSTENLRICLSDETRLIRCFKVTELPPFNARGEFFDPKLHDENISLKNELSTLQLKYESACAMMKDATERLKTSNRRKDDIEEALVKQLSKTERVLRKARGNLEKQAHEAGYNVKALKMKSSTNT